MDRSEAITAIETIQGFIAGVKKFDQTLDPLLNQALMFGNPETRILATAVKEAWGQALATLDPVDLGECCYCLDDGCEKPPGYVDYMCQECWEQNTQEGIAWKNEQEKVKRRWFG